MEHKLRSLDPMLGFAYNMDDLPDRKGEKKIPGFVILESDDTKAEKLKIVVLGGSTSSPYFEFNWPRQLKKIFTDSDKAVTIYNGAVNGYSTNQELLKFIRDVIHLNPDIVISLNGINDLGFIHSIRKHPLIHPYSNFVLRSVLKKGISSKQKDDAINDLNFGPPKIITPIQQWYNNLKIMNLVSSSFSMKFLSFLQPTLGIGDYDIDEKEQEMLDDYCNNMNPQYLKEAEEFYSQAKKIANENNFIVDLANIYDGKSKLYYNARHPNKEGYEIIAKNIFKHLF